MKENLSEKTVNIDWIEAKKLIATYNIHPDRIIAEVYDEVTDASQKPQVFKLLSGFSFPISEVREIIDQSGTERFFIALAYHDDTIRPTEKKGFSAVIMGMDANDKLLVDSDHKISNYCKPCPTMCPTYCELDDRGEQFCGELGDLRLKDQ